MGQLEKYGLYVLCLVICLILGVTIMHPDLPQVPKSPAAAGAGAGTSGAGLNATNTPGGSTVAPTAPKNFIAAMKGSGGDESGTKGSGGSDKNGTGAKPADGPHAVDATAQKNTKVPAKGDAPAEPPADKSSPAIVAKHGTYKIVSGDSFDSISKKLFGSTLLRAEIARLNPSVEPRRLQIGQELEVPSKEEAEQILGKAEVSAETAAAKTGATKTATTDAHTPVVRAITSPNTYVVAKGDTFEGIAIRQLGSRSRVNDLREANPNVDPTRMKIGQRLQLPKK